MLVNWKQVIYSYLYSFIIYFVWEWVILNKLDRFIYNNYINTGWLQDAVTDPGFKMIFVVVISWPMLIFYSMKLVKEKFSLFNFIVSLTVTMLFFCGLVVLWFYVMVIGLGYIGRTYF